VLITTVVAAGVLGCSNRATSSSATPPAKPSSEIVSAPPGETPPSVGAPPGADPCGALPAQYDAIRSAAKGRCTQDADCACYGDLRFDNQTHVTDRGAAARLQALSDAYRSAHCPTVCVQVAPAPACKARCEAGACR
jgi:hypothetical protein